MHYSTELTHPVPWDFVSLEHLFSEFLIPTIFDCIHFEPVRVGIHVMVLSEEVTHRVECSNDEPNHTDYHFGIRDFAS